MQERLEIIAKNTEEIVTEEEMKHLLHTKTKPVAYCGYEPSGPMHLGHLVTVTKLLDLQRAGFHIKILLADVHALLNRKGTEAEVKRAVTIWKKTIKALKIQAEIVLGSTFQFKKEYQLDVMKLAQHATINRGIKSMQEIARDAENATISQLWYPLMQAADIKHLAVDVAVGGMEQRKVHMIGKDEAKTLEYRFIALHTPLITSLKGPGQKMSKSIPGSGIAVTDTYEEIKKAISEAYCPAKETKENPILQIVKLIIFPRTGAFKIKRPPKFGGPLVYEEYASLESHYSKGELHPLDLKGAVIESLENIMAPIRKNFK